MRVAAPGKWVATAGAVACLVATVGLSQLHAKASAPRFAARGELIFPADYRSWTFLTSGHGMSYNPVANAAANAPFDNVFVQPAAHAVFLKTGHWPVGTILVLEIRGSSEKGSINLHGAFQSGKPLAVEVHVRDDRFKGGWGFFAFEGEKPAAPIPYTETC